nr:zinc finger protein 862-like [Pocillopora verrucosa]
MDIRAFLSSSKSSESSQTSTTSTSKRAIDDSSTSQSSSKRKFVRSWLKDFTWLTYDSEGNRMFCKFCRDNPTCSDSSSTFVSGSQNFKIESVRSHETSTGHTRCVAAAKVSENPQLAPLPRALLSMSKEVSQKMERLFDIAYFVAKREMPFTSFPHLCKLEMKHGVELGNTYINDKACKTFVTAIAGQLKHELSSKLQSSKFISVMADSACDVGVREVEDVYACHLVKGEIENSFVGLKACENSKAPGIKAAVETAMTEVCRDWKEKTVALGADGANVMLGEISGVYGLLKQEIPHIIKVHCVAHRLELSFADTLSDVPVLKDVKKMLQGIWKHYHYSAKAVRELEELAEIMKVRAYQSKQTAQDALSKVSLSFQEDGITISRVQDNLTALLAKLESFKERPGQQLNSFLTEVGDGNTFKGIELQRDADRQAINPIQASVVNAAMTFIQERFEGMETDPVLSAAAVLTNHRGWPVTDRHRLLLYGKNEIQTLHGHFQTACCERGNSCMNRIMTDWRSTLNVSTIDELMRIAISGPSHEDYTAVLAVGRWLEESERSRRPTLMD